MVLIRLGEDLPGSSRTLVRTGDVGHAARSLFRGAGHPDARPCGVRDHTEGMVRQQSLRRSVVTALKPTLFVSLSTDVGQRASSVQPYQATVKVRWSPDDGPDVDPDELSKMAHVQIQTYLPELFKFLPEALAVTVGSGRFAVMDLSAPECLGDMVGQGLDLGLVAQVLRGEDASLTPLRSEFPGARERILIADYLQIDPGWRGAGYGVLAMNLVVGALRELVDVAALYPMGPGLTDFAAREASHAALSRYWANSGFRPFDSIMVRDLR